MSKCVVGASQDGGEEEAAGNEEETPEGGAVQEKKLNTFNIYGTLKSQEDYQKNESVKEIIDVISLILSK